MDKHSMLDSFFTTYAYQKNTFLRRFVKRVDKEQIPLKKIHANTLLAFPIKLLPGSVFGWLDIYDRWVAFKVSRSKSKIFIGWSGMSLRTIRAAKMCGMITIVERGSSHILYQNRILQEEYKKFGIDFSIDKRIIEKEMKEYQEADYISVPSYFVKNSFIAEGIPEEKIFMNPYGVGNFFKPSTELKLNKKFTILYLGTLSIRKGLVYLFEALNILAIEEDAYEVWFIGKVNEELDEKIKLCKRKNWKFYGHVDHYDLQKYLVLCDIAVHPSVEEGLSMVIPQLMSCGVPIIATTNTGAENIIIDGQNGFIIPICSPEAIAEKLQYVFKDCKALAAIKKAAIHTIENGFTWNDYGKRYADFLNSIIKNLNY